MDRFISNKEVPDGTEHYNLSNIKLEQDGVSSHHEDDLIAQIQQESSDLEVEPSFILGDSENGDHNSDEIFMQHMDIREPLSTLRTLLEQRLCINLSNFSFWLQDSQILENHKNLVDQCVQGEGLVQVNVQIRQSQSRINIVDVLKPAEDYLDEAESDSSPPPEETNKKVIRWIVDEQYKKDQERLKIPNDPKKWTQAHVRHWLQWAVRQFKLVNLKLADWNITGEELCNLQLDEFQAKVPSDPGDVFWTHLELLRKCKFVAVVQKDTLPLSNKESAAEKAVKQKSIKSDSIHSQQENYFNFQIGNQESFNHSFNLSNKNINCGQVQLWQFLLELLTDKEYTNIIQWLGSEGEFKLSQPEAVAKLWGARKNKPHMNYEKLSRALRYYYDGDMISKVQGKRFVYKFVCDLKQLLGYSAAELSKLVNEDQHYY